MKYLAFTQDVEAGYRFLRNCWGKGFATESASLLMRLCIREFGLHSVIGLTGRENAASAHVLKTTGMSYERQIRGESCLGVRNVVNCVSRTGKWRCPTQQSRVEPAAFLCEDAHGFQTGGESVDVYSKGQTRRHCGGVGYPQDGDFGAMPGLLPQGLD